MTNEISTADTRSAKAIPDSFDDFPQPVRDAATRLGDLIAEVEVLRLAQPRLARQLAELETAYDQAAQDDGAAIVDQLLADPGAESLTVRPKAVVTARAELDAAQAAMRAIDERADARQGELAAAAESFKRLLWDYGGDLVKAMQPQLDQAVALLNKVAAGAYVIDRRLGGATAKVLHRNLADLKLKNPETDERYRIEGYSDYSSGRIAPQEPWKDDAEAVALFAELGPLADLLHRAERLTKDQRRS